jgi:hypothetical protein
MGCCVAEKFLKLDATETAEHEHASTAVITRRMRPNRAGALLAMSRSLANKAVDR